MEAVEEPILAPLDHDERVQLQALLEKVTAVLPRPSQGLTRRPARAAIHPRRDGFRRRARRSATARKEHVMSTTATTEVGTNRWYLSAAPIARALVHLCVPMAAAMIVGAVYNVINAGFIGSLHDAALLAAITFGTPLLGLVMAVGGVFGVGGGSLISRLLGASEQDAAQADEIKHVSSFALWGAVIVGVDPRRHRPAPAPPARRRCSARTPPRSPRPAPTSP